MHFNVLLCNPPDEESEVPVVKQFTKIINLVKNKHETQHSGFISSRTLVLRSGTD